MPTGLGVSAFQRQVRAPADLTPRKRYVSGGLGVLEFLRLLLEILGCPPQAPLSGAGSNNESPSNLLISTGGRGGCLSCSPPFSRTLGLSYGRKISKHWPKSPPFIVL